LPSTIRAADTKTMSATSASNIKSRTGCTAVHVGDDSGVQEISWLAGRGSVSPQEFLLRFVAKNMHQIRAEPMAGIGQHRLRAYTVEGFTLLHAVAVGECASIGVEVRDRKEIDGDGKDRFVLMTQLSGERKVSQLGRCQNVKAGSSTLFCTSEPYTIETQAWHNRNELVAFFMPGEFVSQRIADSKQYCVRTSATGGNLQDMVAGTMQLFARDAWKFSQEEFYRSARVVADLVLLGLNAPSASESGARSIRMSNLSRVKQIVRQKMDDPDLTLADIAQAAGLSLNYLHNLFRDQGQTLYEFLKNERLLMARKLLETAKSRGLTVTAVGLDCGFADPSYFSRSYKHAFGVSPREALLRG
jgi:AraC-like DNA-binding protein